MRLLGAILACLALAACAGPRGYYERLLTPKAKPTEVVATEIAFARAAREEGWEAAFDDFAAADAVIFTPGGAIDAEAWLEARKGRRPMEWEPHAVWSSCDGSVAVTHGGYRASDGTGGVFVTVWERQRDDEYEWVFDFDYPTEDVPSKPDIIAAKTADCSEPYAADVAAAASEVQFAAESWPGAIRDWGNSDDGTLVWGYSFLAGRGRHFAVKYWNGASYVDAFDLTVSDH